MVSVNNDCVLPSTGKIQSDLESLLAVPQQVRLFEGILMRYNFQTIPLICAALISSIVNNKLKMGSTITDLDLKHYNLISVKQIHI